MITKPGVYTLFDPTGKKVEIIAEWEDDDSAFDVPLKFTTASGEECVDMQDGSIHILGGPKLSESDPTASS